MPDNKVASQRGPAALSVGKDKICVFYDDDFDYDRSIGEYLYHCDEF